MQQNQQRTTHKLDSLLRPQTKVDLIVEVDFINDRIDVRTTMALDYDETKVLLTQPLKPLYQSMIGQKMDATFVAPDPITREIKRWGWTTQILGIDDNFKFPNDPTETPYQIVMVSAPQPEQLTETNNRLDYRLTIGNNEEISIQTHPSFGRVELIDFSAGGALMAVPAPPQTELGMRLWFTLFFPDEITVNGAAEIIRIQYEPAIDRFARIGLKFHDLDLNSTRTLQKMVNHFMLQEQRRRNKNQMHLKK